MSGNDQFERELESFLAEENSRVAALYKKLPRPEPDTKLDAAVLSMARAAIAPRRRRSGWMPALSAAAVLMVVAGLAYRTAPKVWEEHSVSAPAPSPAVPPASAPAPQPMRDAPVTENALQTTPVTGSTIRRVDIEAPPAAASDALQKSKTLESAPSMAPPKPAQPRTPPIELKRERQVAEKPAPAPPAPPAQAEPLNALDAKVFPADKQQQVEPERADAEQAERASLNGGAQGRFSNNTAPAVSDAPHEFVPSPPAPPPPPPPPAREMAAPAASTAPMSESVRKQSTLYPEHWIANIQKMLHERKRDEALQNLDAFRKMYPDYRLPDDLRDLK